MAGKYIFVAEDDKALLKALHMKLVLAGFNVKIATDGQQAIELLESGAPDLLLIDLVMPKVDGFGVLEKIGSSGEIDYPVIVTSNLSQEEDKARAAKLGAVDYLVKSDTPLDSIIERVEALVR